MEQIGKDRYELAALDMDGTLLNTDHEASAFTREALSRAAAAGKVIALCTGRCLSELWPHFEANPGVAYAIGENGGCLYDVKGKRMVYQMTIAPEEAMEILELTRAWDVCVQCFMGGQSYMQLESAEALGPYHIAEYGAVFDAGSRYVPDVISLARGRTDVEKINLFFTGVADKTAFNALLQRFDIFVADSLGYGLEISPRMASKSAGLERLCAHLGLPLSAAMAVGDGGNDVDLMRAAGLSVAMGNATEPVKAAADVVTEDCDHDGAARAVLRYLLGETV